VGGICGWGLTDEELEYRMTRRKNIEVLRCIGWPTFIVFLMLKYFGIIHWHWFFIILPIPLVFIGFISAVIVAVLLFLIILVLTFIITTLSK